MVEDCIFCKIIKGDIPSTKVYEDEYMYAFEDINKEAKEHILVVPKVHISSLNEVNDENEIYVSNILRKIPYIADLRNIKESGYRVVTNIGEDAGQTVKHLHFHILGGENLGEKIISK